ncbi:MAG: FHA domain-containing protein [Planctomycetota bacterium]
MSLEDLIASETTEQEFLRAHQVPALLIAFPEESEEAARDVGMHTEIFSSTMIQASLGEADAALLRSSRLEWLQKSDRNPFSNLIMIGRARTNDIVLANPGVSKVHATFSQLNGEWQVQDGRARNGTYLNGEQLEPGGKRKLEDGDGLGFGGRVVARFLSPASVWSYVQQLRR